MCEDQQTREALVLDTKGREGGWHKDFSCLGDAALHKNDR